MASKEMMQRRTPCIIEFWEVKNMTEAWLRRGMQSKRLWIYWRNKFCDSSIPFYACFPSMIQGGCKIPCSALLQEAGLRWGYKNSSFVARQPENAILSQAQVKRLPKTIESHWLRSQKPVVGWSCGGLKADDKLTGKEKSVPTNADAEESVINLVLVQKVWEDHDLP